MTTPQPVMLDQGGAIGVLVLAMTHKLSQLHGPKVDMVADQVRYEVYPEPHHIIKCTALPGRTYQLPSSSWDGPMYTKSQHQYHLKLYLQMQMHSHHLSLCFQPPTLLKLQVGHNTKLHYYR